MFRVRRIAERLARPGDEVLAAVFTPAELARSRASAEPARALAACFAAKEAVVKALGGASGRGFLWQDIEVRAAGQGPAAVHLSGRAAAAAAELGVTRIRLTVGGTGAHAIAGAVLEGGRADGSRPRAGNESRDASGG